MASSEERLAEADKVDLWDSGKVASDQSIQVEYAGKTLDIADGLPLEGPRLGQGRQDVGLE